MKLTDKVVEVAGRFVGEKEAGGNNAGFADPEFQKQMERSGFKRGMRWCSIFAETVFRISLEEEGRQKLWGNLEGLFSSSAVETLERFSKKGYSINQTPKVGDLVVWRLGAGPSGHIGIVTGVGSPLSKRFATVEGNTTDSGDTIDNDADRVARKKRRYGQTISSKPGAFNLLGFVSPV